MSIQAASTSGPVASAGQSGSLASKALTVGAIGTGIALLGFLWGLFGGPSRLVYTPLIGFAFWASLLVGALFFVMITYLFDSGWSVVVRRQLEHALSGFPILAAVFAPLLIVSLVPVAGSTGVVWPWLDTARDVVGGGTVGSDVLWVHKSGYLNPVFFTIRVVLFFGIWIFLASKLRQASFGMDKTGDPANYRAARFWSALGIPLLALSATAASIDWFKSINFHWFSTMYGVWFFAASLRAALAATVIVCAVLAARGYLKGIYNRSHSYLLGCLLLAFTVFWAYISFSQYFLIYNANIPEETFWYNIREVGIWNVVGWLLVLAHFGFPFLYLLFYKNKFGGRILFICGWILAFHLLDLYFNILPQKIPTGPGVNDYYVTGMGGFVGLAFDAAALVGIGGLLVWSFVRSSAKAEPIPVRDPRIEESIHYHV